MLPIGKNFIGVRITLKEPIIKIRMTNFNIHFVQKEALPKNIYLYIKKNLILKLFSILLKRVVVLLSIIL